MCYEGGLCCELTGDAIFSFPNMAGISVREYEHCIGGIALCDDVIATIEQDGAHVGCELLQGGMLAAMKHARARELVDGILNIVVGQFRGGRWR